MRWQLPGNPARCVILLALAGCQEGATVTLLDAGGPPQTDAGACVEGLPCNDGDPCTEGETCVGGECKWGAPKDCSLPIATPCWTGVCNPTNGKCVAQPADDGQPCPQIFCTTGAVCQGGSCIGDATDCSALDSWCTVGICNPADGACVTAAANDGAACDDGSLCTTNERCYAGVCGGLSPTDVIFEDDFSDAASGWQLGPEWQIGAAEPGGQPIPSEQDPAQDHSATDDDGIAGIVLGGTAETKIHDYSWAESPVIDLSAVAGTVTVSYWRWLNSDRPPHMTNAVQAWDGAMWVELWSGPPADSDYFLIESTWSFWQHDVTAYKNAAFKVRFGFAIGIDGVAPVGSWNLDDVRVVAGSCDEKGCYSSVPKLCTVTTGDMACNVSSCDPGTGACIDVPANESANCGDPPCASGSCASGVCVIEVFADGIACDTVGADPCHAGVCTKGKCVLTEAPEGYACSSGNPCTKGMCASGVCLESPAKQGKVCAKWDEQCSDGLCDDGICVPSPANEGADCYGGPCQVGSCSGGKCVTSAVSDGMSCPNPDGDFSGCVTGTCQNGACQPVPAPDGYACVAENALPCQSGICQGGVCEAAPAPDGADCAIAFPGPCERGVCNSGVCGKAAKPESSYCPDPEADGCNVGSCDAQGACVLQPLDGDWCFDNDPCTAGDHCAAGTCIGTPLDCSALDETCSVGACKGGVCEPAPINEGAACSSACVPSGTCQGGACAGANDPGTDYFSETFADNAAGWTLGPEWEIGPAKSSSGQDHGFPDPSVDTSPTDDNGVAGVVLGGNTSKLIHAPFYLESPTVDLGAAQGPVYLVYQRWLNSDTPEWMVDTVEVYDGAAWSVVWQNPGGLPHKRIEDDHWTVVSHDVTPFANPAFRFRFGVAVVSNGSFVTSSWNIDDLALRSTPCP